MMNESGANAVELESKDGIAPEIAHILTHKITPDQVLHLVLRETLWDWGHLDYAIMPFSGLTPAEGSISFEVALNNPRLGMVAISAPLALGEALAVSATGDPEARNYGREALIEFCQRIRERLEGGQARTLHSPPCIEIHARFWPKQEPKASICVLVLGQRLELRQWEA